jgi:hypothetical protein
MLLSPSVHPRTLVGKRHKLRTLLEERGKNKMIKKMDKERTIYTSSPNAARKSKGKKAKV